MYAPMLELMIKLNKQASRVESSKVTEAVHLGALGADCLILFKKTSIGNHPILCMRILDMLCQKAELSTMKSRKLSYGCDFKNLMNWLYWVHIL